MLRFASCEGADFPLDNESTEIQLQNREGNRIARRINRQLWFGNVHDAETLDDWCLFQAP